MKHIWKSALALLLALAMTAGAFGCGSKKDADEKSTSESAASESSAEESAQPVTESLYKRRFQFPRCYMVFVLYTDLLNFTMA